MNRKAINKLTLAELVDERDAFEDLVNKRVRKLFEQKRLKLYNDGDVDGIRKMLDDIPDCSERMRYYQSIVELNKLKK